MTVFVVQEPTRYNSTTGGYEPTMDLRPAAEYGRMEFLLSPGPVMLTPMPMVQTLRRKLRTFNDEDYILPVGDPVAIGTAVALAAQNNAGRFTMLRWDRGSRLYVAVKISLFE